MKEVYAIKRVEDIHLIENFFAKNGWHQMRWLFTFGINVALRISDLLNIKWEDIEGDLSDGTFFKEQKRGKVRNIVLNERALQALRELKKLNPDSIYVFQSMSNVNKANPKPISRQYVGRKLSEAQEACHIKENLGTHSMRKTFGYHKFKAGVPLPQLMRVFGHSSQEVTARYIGVSEPDIADVYLKNPL